MNKKHILYFLAFLLLIISKGQERIGIEDFAPVNTPDVMAFSKVNFLPVNEYTGKPNITIPIYEIDLDGLKIPISLSYNYGGIKINTVSSNVGIGWSLNAGGKTVIERSGVDDWANRGYMNINPVFPIADNEPDLYKITSPGLESSFITVNNNYGNDYQFGELVPTKSITKDGALINAYYGNSGSSVTLPNPHNNGNISMNAKGISKILVTNLNGFKYQFGDNGYVASTYTRSRRQYWWSNGQYQGGNHPSDWKYDGYIGALNISEINNPRTQNKVVFSYGSPLYGIPWLEDIYEMYKGAFYPNNQLKYKFETLVKTREEKLNKIEFPNGSVEFFYEHSRQDLPTSGLYGSQPQKALSRVLIKNLHGKIIKDARFIYSNIRSKENCSEPECYRLFLNRIDFYGENGNQIPGYTFNYNSRKLPKRYAYIQDFLGYYNGATANPHPGESNHFIPKTYHKPNSGRNSFLPLNLNLSGYSLVNGNYSLASNATYAKAGILERITYPTGGFTDFISESNQFKYLNKTINGGGLRIKQQKVFDSNGSLENTISYEYKLSNGSSSGSITYMPRFNDYDLTSPSAVDDTTDRLAVFQNDMANQKTTYSSYVGYSRVKISQTGNGYTVKEFTSPQSNPNIPGSWNIARVFGASPSFQVPLIIQEAVDNGAFPNIVTDRDLLRGKILNEKIFKEGSIIPLVERSYDYSLTEYEDITVSGSFPIETVLDADNPHHLRESSKLKVERNLMVEKTETSNLEGTELETITTYQYDANYPLVTSERFKDSQQTIVTKNSVYPHQYNLEFEQTDIVGNNVKFGYEYGCRFDMLLKNPLEKMVEENRISEPWLTIINKKGAVTFDNPSASNTKSLPASSSLYLYDKISEDDNTGVISSEEYFSGEHPMVNKKIVAKGFVFELASLGDNPLTPNNVIYKCKIADDAITEYEIDEYFNYKRSSDKFDAFQTPSQNPYEIKFGENGVSTLVIWGYNYQYPVARITSPNIDEIKDVLLEDQGGSKPGSILFFLVRQSNADNDRTLNYSGNEGALRQALDGLRTEFPSAQISTYTYDPLIGVTSVTSPTGQVQYYEYDAFNRLKQVKDQDGKVLSENEYHYKN